MHIMKDPDAEPPSGSWSSRDVNYEIIELRLWIYFPTGKEKLREWVLEFVRIRFVRFIQSVQIFSWAKAFLGTGWLHAAKTS